MGVTNVSTNITRVQRYEALANRNDDKPAGGNRNIIADFGETLAQGAAAAAQVALPIAQQVMPALAGGGPAGALAGSAVGSGFGAEGSQTALLQLQRQIQQEALFYQTVSNIDKTRHDSAMNAARNIKQ
jgi:hypothetical protein